MNHKDGETKAKETQKALVLHTEKNLYFWEGNQKWSIFPSDAKAISPVHANTTLWRFEHLFDNECWPVEIRDAEFIDLEIVDFPPCPTQIFKRSGKFFNTTSAGLFKNWPRLRLRFVFSNPDYDFLLAMGICFITILWIVLLGDCFAWHP
jgi:hypothetical protein